MLRQYLFYLVRWQLSTPILAVVLIIMASYNRWTATIIANLVGALLFFWVDRYIFRDTVFAPLWEIREQVSCADCHSVAKGYRLVKTKNYDRTKDPRPEFRCEKCSHAKLSQLKKKGVIV